MTGQKTAVALAVKLSVIRGDRAVKAIKPDADFSISGAESFRDEKLVSSWALEPVRFMSKNEFIKGSGGYFDPKGTTTREMAVLIAVRVYEKYAGISK